MAEWLTLQASKHGDRVTARSDAAGTVYFYAPDLYEIKHAKSDIGRIYAWRAQMERKYDDPEFHLRREQNREIRADIRRFEKTKAGMAEIDARKRAERDAKRLREGIELAPKILRRVDADAIVPSTWPMAWVNGVYVPVRHPEGPKRKRYSGKSPDSF